MDLSPTSSAIKTVQNASTSVDPNKKAPDSMFTAKTSVACK
jgi:hypothetical protein